MKARDYQEAANRAVWRYFEVKDGNPIVAMPTGTGKSFVIADFIRSAFMSYPQTKILVLTHVKELIENNYNTLTRIFPAAPAGIYSAGLDRRDIGCAITFAGIGSIHKRARLFKETDIVIIDECHLVSDDKNTMYARFLSALKVFNPKLKIIGLSATPYRMKMGMLIEGKLFTDICFDLTSGDAFNWLIEQHYLSPVIPVRPENTLDATKLRVQNGDYSSSSVHDAFTTQKMTGKALDETMVLAADRKKWIIFASGIDHAEECAKYLQGKGVLCRVVHSKMSDEERNSAIKEFENGEIRAIVNRDILTTGFDVPDIDCIVMLRPTKSPGLWVQMIGRGTRPVFKQGVALDTKEDRARARIKMDCLVLDFVGNTHRIGPINDPILPKQHKKGQGEAPTKNCPKCPAINHAAARVCIKCGYEFPVADKISDIASSADLVRKGGMEDCLMVISMSYQLYQKPGKPNSVAVGYVVQEGRKQRVVKVWLRPEHTDYYSKRQFKFWWRKVWGSEQHIPMTTPELLKAMSYLKQPTHIKAIKSGNYDEVLDYDYTGSAFGTIAPRVEKTNDSQLSDMHEFR